jgi:hypothetical protein
LYLGEFDERRYQLNKVGAFEGELLKVTRRSEDVLYYICCRRYIAFVFVEAEYM